MQTIEEIARELERLSAKVVAEAERARQRIDGRVSKVLYEAEITNLKADVEKLEKKIDRMIESQYQTQRTAIFQLITIIVTLVVAAYGVFS